METERYKRKGGNHPLLNQKELIPISSRKKLAYSAVPIVLLLTLIIWIPSTVSAEEETISQETAQKAVEADLSGMNPDHEFYEPWQSAEVEYEKELYDLEDKVIGYYFLLKSETETVGYYVTSARTDLPPILEYGIKSDFAEAANDEHLYYFGGSGSIAGRDSSEAVAEISDRLATQNEATAAEEKGKLYDSRSTLAAEQEATPPEQRELDEVVASLELDADPNAVSHWERLLNPPQGLTAAALPETYKLNIPFIYQRMAGITGPGSACGPTALAMILEYLGNQGFDVEDSRYYNNSIVNLVNGNRNIMSTGVFGTTSGNMVFGLNNTLRPGWTITSINADSSGAIEKYKSRIASGRPPALMWDKLILFPWTDAQLKWHWQAGSAYTYSGGSFMFGVKDPDRDATTRYYNWNSNQSGFLFISYAK